MSADYDDAVDPKKPINEAMDGLLRIQREAARSRSALHGFTERQSPPAPSLHADPLETALRLLRFRRQRDAAFSSAGYDKGMFGEPVWDMLLDLYVAGKRGRKISVSSLCIAAAVPATTALRHINMMLQKGLVKRQPDPDDARRVWIELTDSTVGLMSDLLSRHAANEAAPG
jgi:DNA-binding MarR family transcriptional regulator